MEDGLICDERMLMNVQAAEQECNASKVLPAASQTTQRRPKTSKTGLTANATKCNVQFFLFVPGSCCRPR